MMPMFQNNTCSPFTPQDEHCALGNLVTYSVNASNYQHVQAAVKFARDHHLRLAIKNTGHDFLGRSTAKGGLGIWTHHLNAVEVIEHTSAGYTGPAMKMGAGTQAALAYTTAYKYGYRTSGGTCPTVGLAGGFTQGGGHGALSSEKGLAADNVLEWEVVTAEAELVTASPSKNSDLFWAISGGGGGTFGVVVSMTTKLWPEKPVAGAILSWNMTTIDAFWESYVFLQSGLTTLVDSGSVAIIGVTNSTISAQITAPSVNDETLESQLDYITTYLNDSSTPYTLSVKQFPTYFEHFTAFYGPLPNGIWPTSHLIGSRLFPRSFFASQSNLSTFVELSQEITKNNEWTISAVTLNANLSVAGIEAGYNAVHPSWRESLVHFTVYSSWDYSLPMDTLYERSERLTNHISPALEALTPGSGTYANEANWNQTGWQHAFFGDNWARLSDVKRTWDPDMVFYSRVSVGAEQWFEDAVSGRLCKLS